jgi:hypothetical protein
MTNATTTQEHPQALGSSRVATAWGIIWLGFAVFCVMCAVSVLGVHYFLFNSSVPMLVVVQVSRGTAGVTGTDLIEQVVRDRERPLAFNDAVTINPDSQGLLLVRDLRDEDDFVAAITLRTDSRVTLANASRPRFDWSAQAYAIDLREVTGDVEVLIAPTLDRAVSLVLAAPGGDQTLLTEPGHYLVTVRGQQMEVVYTVGSAVLVSDDRAATRSIPSGQRAVMRMSTNEIELLPGFVNLLGDSGFDHSGAASASTALTPEGMTVSSWICADPPTSMQPRGGSRYAARDGRSSIMLERGDGVTTHGETRCTKLFGPGAYGLDISGYNYLALRVTFLVDGQSLAVCGTAGTECPLMLEMQYVPDAAVSSEPPVRPPDVFGSVFDPLRESPVRKWHQGFYAVPMGENRSPLRCDTCPQEHTLLRPERWYSYDSGNLLALFPPGQRPRFLLNLSFYASGHDYAVFVSEVSLLAGQIEVVS